MVKITLEDVMWALTIIWLFILQGRINILERKQREDG